ncbi:MAG: YjbQ family protein [Myxococcales bacterium]|nr:YjbQ family protein [Myxococcales bacterium]
MARRTSFEIATRGRGTHEITRDVAAAIPADAGDALALVFCHHTSASLIVCERADPTVRADLERFMAAVVPDGDPMFEHADEGDDDMPAHVRTILTQTSLTVPIHGGRLDLGTWQGLYLWEHRAAPHRRRVSVTIVG